MNLIIDTGNTATKIAVMDDNRVIFRQRVEIISVEMVSALLDEYPSIDKAIVASTGEANECVCGILR